MTYTYPHVEDYIEIIAGYREPDGTSNNSVFFTATPLLSLARYDVKVVDNMAESTMAGMALTDRQAQLAVELIRKYERQLAKHKIEIGALAETTNLRKPARTIDRSTAAYVEDNVIRLRFPYNGQLIESIRAAGKTSKGRIRFNRDLKVWEGDLTEYNVNWFHSFALAHNFTVDPSLQELMDLILAEEQKPYEIKLTAGEQLDITNVPDSLHEYIVEKMGGFGTDNLLTLVDNAPVLGYTVDKIIEETCLEAYGPRAWSLLSNRELKADASNTAELLAGIVNYAEITNRFPIFVSEPDLSDRIIMLMMRHFTKEQVLDWDHSGRNITADTKFVYTRKFGKVLPPRIPLMLSTTGMLFGGDKALWMQNAEKIVYFTKEVYNKNTNVGTDLCKLN